MAKRKIYKVGVVFEFDPKGEHDFLFEGMSKKEIEADMIRMATEDVYAGHGSVEIVSVEEVED
jgi:hypothetical protein